MFLQETQDPSAALWLDEIQDTILKANQDTQEALHCKRNISFSKYCQAVARPLAVLVTQFGNFFLLRVQ